MTQDSQYFVVSDIGTGAYWSRDGWVVEASSAVRFANRAEAITFAKAEIMGKHPCEILCELQLALPHAA